MQEGTELSTPSSMSTPVTTELWMCTAICFASILQEGRVFGGYEGFQDMDNNVMYCSKQKQEKIMSCSNLGGG